MNVAFLGLGGNMGDRVENIRKTIAGIKKDCGKILRQSGIYETQAWGTDSEKKYLNLVVKLETQLSAEELLEKTGKIEKRLGRKRTEDQNADRTADIDILFFNNDVINRQGIQIPHPRLHLRRFVLIPLAEIENKLVHPILKKNITGLLENCRDKLDVRRIDPQKHLKYICVEGNIGSGKTTLAKAFAKKTGAALLLEEFETNHLLPLFYADPKMYSFPVEFSFLISRFEQMTEVFKTHKNLIISDFSIYKCLWFAKVNLTKKEYLLFKKHFNAFSRQLPEPDLVIHLSTSFKNLKHNIKKRGRSYEQTISVNYLEKVAKEYGKGLKQLTCPIFGIPVKKYYPQLEKESIKSIENYLKENFGQIS
jgi:deoxyguanosine kinase